MGPFFICQDFAMVNEPKKNPNFLSMLREIFVVNVLKIELMIESKRLSIH